jgi:hypothetical protein
VGDGSCEASTLVATKLAESSSIDIRLPLQYHSLLFSPFLYYILYRVILSVEPSILHVMSGRLATQMDTLPSPATGLKKILLVGGNARLHCSDPQRSIMHTTGSILAVHCSKFLIVLALHIRFVLLYYKVLSLLYLCLARSCHMS